MEPTKAPDGGLGLGSRIARHYGSQPEAYRDLWAPALASLSRWVIDDLPLADAHRVLDLGCGVGSLLPHLRDASPHATIVGLDRTEAMIALAPREFPLVVGDATRLPFRERSFDAIVAAFMLFHLPDPTAGLHEMRRILSPGGWVGLLTWGSERESRASDLWEEELDAEAAAHPGVRRSWHELVDTPAKVTRHLTTVGFEAVRSRVEVFRDRPTTQELLARKTKLGDGRYRWMSLNDGSRRRVLARALPRLEAMQPEDFEAESEVIVTVGRRPERGGA